MSCQIAHIHIFILLPLAAFTDALYDQIVAKATGQMLSLDDFVIVVVLYSMYGRNDILRLVFNMFDKVGSHSALSLTLFNVRDGCRW